MTDVLGLPLEEALKRLKESGAGNILVTRYTSPRAHDTRGSLRVVRVSEDMKNLVACAFNDEITVDTENCNESLSADK